MAGVRLGGRAFLPVPSSPPYTVYEDASPFSTVWQIVNGTPTRLSDAGASNGEDISNPAISPDGTKAAYDTNFPGTSGEGQIGWAAGGAHTVISPADPNGNWFRHPAWTPDGAALVYVHGATGEGTDGSIVITTLASPGSETVLYTPSPVGTPSGYGAYRPQVSPDGTKIAFILNSSGGSLTNCGLYVMDINGASPTKIHTHNGYTFDGEDISWSPDGTLIAYRALQSPSGSFSPIYVIEPDGTNARKISIGDTDTSPDLGTSVGKRVSKLAWAADSSYVVASAQWWTGAASIWVPWRYEIDGTTPETRLSSTYGPAGFEFFRNVYVYDNRIWFIDSIDPGRVVSLAMNGTDYVIGHNIDTIAALGWQNGAGFSWR